ncbi:MAG: hypothetical protein ACQEXN_08080 [Actinomycetota bacterium]
MSGGPDRGEEAWLPDGGAPLPDGDAGLASGGLRKRVRVVAPRSAAPQSAGHYTFSHELAEQSEIGELFVRSLVRSQLRLAVVVAAGFGLILLGVAVLIALVPVTATLTIATIPLPWLLLGIGIYPVILACAALYNRAAARNERKFRELTADWAESGTKQ